MEVGVGIGEFVDHLLADRRGRRAFDVGSTGVAEELLVLDLHPLPRRVADDAGESACPPGTGIGAAIVGDSEDTGELQVPVEEPILPGESH